ncbi:MAG: ADP-forming succinate--CoA ligase subunit beta [Bdellovibrionales bacterium]|nr:ADP-forming succinate--CoA ligase subunit beta [Bdellovibrionales bacterium]
MKIHEHQAKEILARYGVPVPRGRVAWSVEQARQVAAELGGRVVVKAQIHAGGRGKGGGVKVAKSLDDVRAHASKILGMQLVTHQTGPEGKKVHKVLVEEGSNIEKELYLSLILDRDTSLVTFIVSTEGGMDIEEVSAKHPEKIGTVAVDPVLGFQAFHGRKIADILALEDPELRKQAASIGEKLYRFFLRHDCSLVEINPLIVTKEKKILPLDAKLNFDDNALYRHPEIVELRDLHEETKGEIAASEYELAYISLDGDIGCMVNGAGLAMSTLDIINQAGGHPANFLDVGGGADKEKVEAAFKIILSDPKVKAILVNIFGGIMKCDVIAEGVIAAAREMKLEVPLVVRLEGTNVEKGKEMILKSGLKITPAGDLRDAAEKAVKAAKGILS